MENTVAISPMWLIISAIATLTLAVAAFVTIRKTQAAQKEERRQRRLSEIINWATDILKCGVVKTAWDVAIVGRESELAPYGITPYDTYIDQFDAIYRLSSHIKALAYSFKRKPELGNHVYNIVVKLYHHLNLLELARQGKVRKLGAVGKHRTTLNELAHKLVTYATEMKTEESM